MISKCENFVESSYSSTEISCLFLKVLPIEGPFLIVPSLETKGLCCDYKLQIYTSKEIQVKELNQRKNPVIIQEWTTYNSGGSHIFNEKYFPNTDKQTWH